MASLSNICFSEYINERVESINKIKKPHWKKGAASELADTFISEWTSGHCSIDIDDARLVRNFMYEIDKNSFVLSSLNKIIHSI